MTGVVNEKINMAAAPLPYFFGEIAYRYAIEYIARLSEQDIGVRCTELLLCRGEFELHRDRKSQHGRPQQADILP